MRLFLVTIIIVLISAGASWGQCVTPQLPTLTKEVSGTSGAAPKLNESFHIFAANGKANDRLGCSVAIDGDTAVVGSHAFRYENSTEEINSGTAYVFKREGASWVLEQQLHSPDTTRRGRFGISVAISGSTIVVGAFQANDGIGRAYVFEKRAGQWSLTGDPLDPKTLNAKDRYGEVVAIKGDTIVIGAHQSVNRPPSQAVVGNGFAEVFRKGESGWRREAVLTASDGSRNDLFGVSVAVDGNTIVVGAMLDDHGDLDQGSAYVFSKRSDGWVEEQRLESAVSARGDGFGRGVAIHGDTILVGAPFENTKTGHNHGAAYIFRKAGTVWCQSQRLLSSHRGANAQFGYGVSMEKDIAVITSHTWNNARGTAVVFMRKNSSWTESYQLVASDNTESDNFGASIAVSGQYIVAGAPFDSVRAGKSEKKYQGSAYIFDLGRSPE